MEESVIKRVSREFLRLLIQLSLNTIKFVVTKRHEKYPIPEGNENITDKKVYKAIHIHLFYGKAK